MDKSGSAGPRRVYGTLDGMRGVAAIAVVIVHAPVLFGSVEAKSAGLAVDLFFVMSGFIIAHAYDAKLATSMSPMTFAIIRSIRLYPMYIMGLALGALGAIATIWLGDSDTWTLGLVAAVAMPGLLMLPAPPLQEDKPAIFPLNPPSWSLFFELLVNFAYATFFPLMRTRTVAAIAILSAVALGALGVVEGDLNAGSHWHNFGGGFARVLYSFGIGILIYRLKDRWKVPVVPPMVILLACAAIFLVDPGEYKAAYEFVAMVAALPILVVLGSASEPGRRLSKPFAYIGLISYGVYSIHYPLVLVTKGVVTKLYDGDISQLTPWLGFAFTGALIAACGLINSAYDVPVRALLTRLFVTRSGKPALDHAVDAKK